MHHGSGPNLALALRWLYVGYVLPLRYGYVQL
jgi:hypothetical protein